MNYSLRALVAFATLGVCSFASANSGTLLPLDQYQAGTEATNNTIVQNGGFEAVTSGNPDGWTGSGAVQVGAPTGPNVSAVNGSSAAQIGATPTGGLNKYVQTVTLQPGADYVLSGYLWNFTGLNFDLAVAEVVNGGGQSRTISLSPSDGGIDGSRGVFGYTSFNTAVLGTNLAVEVEFDLDENVAGTRPSLAAQLDNISITPEADFRAPAVLPEPASLAIVGMGAALLRRRR
jgi:hypothetical protein